MGITPPAPEEPFALSGPPPRPPGPRRERWPVPFLVVATVAGIALGLSLMEPPQQAGSAAAAAEPAEALEPFGDGGSLVEPPNLRAVLAASSEEAGATRLVGLRVSAENVQAEWQVDATTQRRTYADRTGRVERQGADTPAAEASLPLESVPPDAPARIARRMAALAGTGTDGVAYLLLDAEGRGWNGYLTQEADVRVRLNPFSADLDGRRVRAAGAGAG